MTTRGPLTRSQRNDMLRAYLDRRASAGQLARRYGVSDAYPRWLAHCHRLGGRPSRSKEASQ